MSFIKPLGVCIILLTLAVQWSLAQDGPGGVGKVGQDNLLKFWFKPENLQGNENTNFSFWPNSQNFNSSFLMPDGVHYTPEIKNNQINGFPALYFDGSKALIENVKRSELVTSGSTGHRIFMVVKHMPLVTGPTVANNLFSIQDNVNPNTFIGLGLNDAGIQNFRLNIIGNQFGSELPVPLNCNKNMLANANFVNAQAFNSYSIVESSLWTNNVLGNNFHSASAFLSGGGAVTNLGSVTLDAVAANCFVDPRFKIGNNPLNNFIGYISEIIGIESDPANVVSIQQILIQNYLSSKYKIDFDVTLDRYTRDGSSGNAGNQVAGIGQLGNTKNTEAASWLSTIKEINAVGNYSVLIGNNHTSDTYTFSEQSGGSRIQRLDNYWGIETTMEAGASASYKLSFPKSIYNIPSVIGAFVPVLILYKDITDYQGSTSNVTFHVMKDDGAGNYTINVGTDSDVSGSDVVIDNNSKYFTFGYININNCMQTLPYKVITNGTAISGFDAGPITIGNLTFSDPVYSSNSSSSYLAISNSDITSDFSGGNFYYCDNFTQVNTTWCAGKLGDISSVKVSLNNNQNSENLTPFSVLPSNALSYLLAITRPTDFVTNELVYFNPLSNGTSWEIPNQDVFTSPNNYLNLNVLSDNVKFTTLNNAKVLVNTPLSSLGNCLQMSVGGSAKTINVKYLNRVWSYSGNENQNTKVELNDYLFGNNLLPSYQVPVMIVSPTGNFESDGVVVALTKVGQTYNYNYQFHNNDKFTFGVLHNFTIDETYATIDGGLGRADLNYAKSTISSSPLSIFNVSSLENSDYLILANNGQNVAFSSTQSSVGQVNFTPLNRLWKVQIFNSIENASFQVDPSAFSPAFDNASDLAIIVDTDGDFSTNADKKFYGLVKNGNQYFAYNIPIGNGNIITVSKAPRQTIISQKLSTEFLESNHDISGLGNQSLYISDVDNYDIKTGCKETLISAYLRLSLNTGDVHSVNVNSGNSKVKVRVKQYDDQSTLLQTTDIDLLINSVSPVQLNRFLLKPNANQVKIELVSYVPSSSTQFENAVRLSCNLEILNKRQVVSEAGYSVINNPRLVNYDPNSSPLSNRVTFSWESDNCPVNLYQLQLLRLYNKDESKISDDGIVTAEVDWSKSLTLETTNPELTLTLAEGTGYYAWRVRPVGNYFGESTEGIADSRNWGAWSTDNLGLPIPGTGLSLDQTAATGYYPVVFYFNQPDADKNFIYSRAFTEQGKIHEGITFANALQQVRQTQARIASEGTNGGQILVSQTLQDYVGRNAFSTLPAPVSDNQDLKFRQNFLMNSGNKSYGIKDFDETVNNPAQVSGGALNSYYSNSNADMGIPSAEGYPFYRTVYRSDGSNKVKEQGSPGDALRIKPINGHTVSYSTSSVDDEELITILGDEAPDGNSVIKESTTDQNGVTSIAYKDKSGKVLATCLVHVDTTDKSPLYQLASEKGVTATDINGSLGANTKSSDDGWVAYKDYEFTGLTRINVNYNYTPELITSICGNYCDKCRYEVKIEVLDLEHSSTVTSFVEKIGSVFKEVKTTNDNCTPPTTIQLLTSPDDLDALPSASDKGALSLIPGRYRIIRTLKLIPGASKDFADKVSNAESAKVSSITDQINIKLKAVVNQLKGYSYGVGIREANKYIADLLNGYINNPDHLIFSLYDKNKNLISGTVDPATFQDGYIFRIKSTCCEIDVPIYKHVYTPCELPEALPNPDYPSATYADRKAAIIQYMLDYLQDHYSQMPNPKSPYNFTDFNPKSNYSESEFTTMIGHLLDDYNDYATDANGDNNPDKSMFYTCECSNIVNKWKSAVEMALPSIPRPTVNTDTDISSSLTNGTSTIKNGDGSVSLPPVTPDKDLVNYFFQNLGYFYKGYTKSNITAKEFGYKVFYYPRTTINKCELVFCARPLTNSATSGSGSSSQNQGFEDVNWPDVNDPNFNRDLYCSNISNASCSMNEVASYDASLSYYKLQQVGSVNSVSITKNLTSNDYLALSACVSNNTSIEAGLNPTDEQSGPADTYSKTNYEKDILARSQKMINDCKNSCNSHRDDFSTKLYALYSYNSTSDSYTPINSNAAVFSFSNNLQPNEEFSSATGALIGWQTFSNGAYSDYSIPILSDGKADLFTLPNYSLYSKVPLSANSKYRLYFKLINADALTELQVKLNSQVIKSWTTLSKDDKYYVEFSTDGSSGQKLSFVAIDHNPVTVPPATNLPSLSIGSVYVYQANLMPTGSSVTNDDLCSTVDMLVDNCISQCKLTPQYVFCDPDNSATVNYYKKVIVNDNPVWEKLSIGSPLTFTGGDLNGTTTDLITTHQSFPINTTSKNTVYDKAYFKVNVNYSDGSKKTCKATIKTPSPETGSKTPTITLSKAHGIQFAFDGETLASDQVYSTEGCAFEVMFANDGKIVYPSTPAACDAGDASETRISVSSVSVDVSVQPVDSKYKNAGNLTLNSSDNTYSGSVGYSSTEPNVEDGKLQIKSVITYHPSEKKTVCVNEYKIDNSVSSLVLSLDSKKGVVLSASQPTKSDGNIIFTTIDNVYSNFPFWTGAFKGNLKVDRSTGLIVGGHVEPNYVIQTNSNLVFDTPPVQIGNLFSYLFLVLSPTNEQFPFTFYADSDGNILVGSFSKPPIFYTTIASDVKLSSTSASCDPSEIFSPVMQHVGMRTLVAPSTAAEFTTVKNIIHGQVDLQLPTAAAGTGNDFSVNCLAGLNAFALDRHNYTKNSCARFTLPTKVWDRYTGSTTIIQTIDQIISTSDGGSIIIGDPSLPRPAMVKYSLNGSINSDWGGIAAFENVRPLDLFEDNNGNIFVLSVRFNVLLILKYSQNGNLLGLARLPDNYQFTGYANTPSFFKNNGLVYVGAFNIQTNVYDVISFNESSFLGVEYAVNLTTYPYVLPSVSVSLITTINIDDNFGSRLYIYPSKFGNYFYAYINAREGFVTKNNLGVVPQGYTDVYIMKIDLNGSKIWSRIYGGSSDDYISSNSFVEDANGDLILGMKVPNGYQLGLGNGDQRCTFLNPPSIVNTIEGITWFVKLDKTSGFVKDGDWYGKWQKYYEMLDGNYSANTGIYENTLSLALMYDGTIAVLSSTVINYELNQYFPFSSRTSSSKLHAYNQFSGPPDYLLYFLDKNGNKRDDHFDITYGGLGHDCALGMAVGKNSDIYITGVSNSRKSNDPLNSDVTDTKLNFDQDVVAWTLRLKYHSEIIKASPQNVCMNWTRPVVPPTLLPTVSLPEPNHNQNHVGDIINGINFAVGMCKMEQYKAVMDNYQTTCLNYPIRETFTSKYRFFNHHYTLYSYDRAGHLVRTVPPAGVETINLSDGNNDANEKARSVANAHRLKTEYQYNSLGQLIQQTTPDGGVSKFFYNRAGQLRASQSARQAEFAVPRFSYTKYDQLGRIIETGEAEWLSMFAFWTLDGSSTLDEVGASSFPTNGIKTYTTTVYTTPAASIAYKSQGQRYLQNRVSYAYTVAEDGKKSSTYYSYDPHGNVEWLVQDIPGFTQNYIAYQYDLISNKVLQVSYNDGHPDQFYHKYAYDADNRLTAVYTSKDGQLWEKDASYIYYAHGPLQRVELGADNVQGLDYYYTLHGWLKAINNPGMVDLKADGATNSSFPKDQYAMALSYFSGDFKKTGSPYDAGSTNILTSSRSLYNGNISAWTDFTYQEYASASASAGITPFVSTASPKNFISGYSFHYDRLNRLLKAQSNFYDPIGNGFSSSSSYQNEYSYDANGNITRLVRNAFPSVNGGSAQSMDQLAYVYPKDANGKLIGNQLQLVKDAVANSPFAEDIEDQTIVGNPTASNYSYDGSGNLIADVQGNISVKWNVFGKVESISPLANQPNAKSIRFFYDASGNRIGKEVNNMPYNASNVLQRDPANIVLTYHVRDASGNVMATYERTHAPVAGKPGYYTATYKMVEQPLYGSSRLGMRKEPNLQVAQEIFRLADYDKLGFVSNYESGRFESQNRIVAAEKNTVAFGAGNVAIKAVSTDWFQVAYSAGANAYTKTQNLNAGFLAQTKSNTSVAEDKEGNMQFYAVTASKYWGVDNVALVFDQGGLLMPGSDGIYADAKAQSAIVQMPGSTTKYFLITKGTDGNLYRHTVDMALQGNAPTGNLWGAVTSKNILVYNLNTNDPINIGTNHGTKLAVLENLDKKYAIIYTSQYTAPAGGNGLGSLDIVAYKLTAKSNNTLDVTKVLMATVPSLDKGQGQGEMQISPDASKLYVYNSKLPIGWFNQLDAEVLAFPLGADYLVDNGIAAGAFPALGSFGGQSIEVSKNGQYVLISSNGISKSTAASGSERSVYAFDVLGGASSLVAAGISGNLRRGLDGRFYVADPNSTDLKAFAISNGGASPDLPANVTIVPVGQYTTCVLPIQNHKVYHEDVTSAIYTRTLDHKRYELTDHLGNVRVVVSDQKEWLPTPTTPDPDVDYGNIAKVDAYTNYYPFGMAMPGRTFTADEYRYGYNGKEQDKENGNVYDYGFRIYNPTIARFLSEDPLKSTYPQLTPYQYASNTPISGIDLDGLEFFYTADGKYLGRIGTSVEVYKADRIETQVTDCGDGKYGHEPIAINPIPLNITHRRFATSANVVKHESSGNRTESLWIAHTANNAKDDNRVDWRRRNSTLYDQLTDKSYSTTPASARTNLSDADNTQAANNARAAVIDVLSGGADPTGGATLWDGSDFLTKGPRHNKFNEYKSISISSDHLTSYSSAQFKRTIKHEIFSISLNTSTPFLGSGCGKYSSLSSAGAKGKTLFWKLK